MRSSGIQAIAYNRLKAHLGMAGGQTMMYDIVQQLAQPEMPVVERFRLDASYDAIRECTAASEVL